MRLKSIFNYALIVTGLWLCFYVQSVDSVLNQKKIDSILKMAQMKAFAVEIEGGNTSLVMGSEKITLNETSSTYENEITVTRGEYKSRRNEN